MIILISLAQIGHRSKRCISALVIEEIKWQEERRAEKETSGVPLADTLFNVKRYAVLSSKSAVGSWQFQGDQPSPDA